MRVSIVYLATLTSLAWIGATGNQTLQVAFDNNRASEYSAPCMPTDSCTGTYYPKRINLVVPANTYLSNYTVSLMEEKNAIANGDVFFRILSSLFFFSLPPCRLAKERDKSIF